MNKLYFTLLFFYSIGILFSQNNTYDNWLQEANPNEWIAERIENANKGIKEIVKMPLVVRSTGWGCLCPDHYIGIYPFTKEGPWIEPVASKKFPTTSVDGHSLIVKGYFTGKMISIDLRNEDGEPEEWLYHVPEFIVKSFRKNKDQENTRAPEIISK